MAAALGDAFGPSFTTGSGPFDGMTKTVLNANPQERAALMYGISGRPQKDNGPWEGHALDMPTHTFDWSVREPRPVQILKVVEKVLSASDRTISRLLMPLSPMPEGGIVRQRRLIAHQTQLVPLPPLGVPPTMDQSYAEWQQAADTWGIGYQSEGRFLESPIGILYYMSAIRRILEAVLDNVDRKGMAELLSSDYHPMFDKTDFGQGKDKLQLSLQANTFEDMLASVFENWNILNRRADGAFLEMAAGMREQLEQRGVRPNVLMLPSGTLAVMRLKPDALRLDAFSDGQSFFRKVGMITTDSGMLVLQAPKMRLPGSPNYVDMLVQERTVGEYHPMRHADNCANVSAADYKSWMRSIQILDHRGQGKMETIKLMDAFMNAGLYNDAGTDLTDIGRALFGTNDSDNPVDTLGQYIQTLPATMQREFVNALDRVPPEAYNGDPRARAPTPAQPDTAGRRGGGVGVAPRKVRTGARYVTQTDREAKIDLAASARSQFNVLQEVLPGLYAAAKGRGKQQQMAPFFVYANHVKEGKATKVANMVAQAVITTEDSDVAAAIIDEVNRPGGSILQMALTTAAGAVTVPREEVVEDALQVIGRGGFGGDSKENSSAAGNASGFGGAPTPAAGSAAAGTAAGASAGAGGGGRGWLDLKLENCLGLFLYMINKDLKLPIDFILDRSVTHRMGSSMALKAGRETGETFSGAANASEGFDAQSRFSFLRFQIDTLAVLWAPENIVHRRNVACHGYVRGGAAIFWKDSERQLRMNPEPVGDPGGLTVYPVRPGDEIKWLFDNTGEYGADVMKYTNNEAMQLFPVPRTAEAVSAKWHIPTAATPFDMEFHAMYGRPAATNSLTFRAPTYFPDKQGDGSTWVTANGGGGLGHWGPDAYNGISRLRMGKDNGVPSRLGGQQVFVSAGGAFNSNYS